jgi:quercetin dioxygenase-like cupin family protein
MTVARISLVKHRTPGTRTAWHTHPHGETLSVLEGVGHCQRRGGPIEVIRPGDRFVFEPGEEPLARRRRDALLDAPGAAACRRRRERRGVG